MLEDAPDADHGGRSRARRWHCAGRGAPISRDARTGRELPRGEWQWTAADFACSTGTVVRCVADGQLHVCAVDGVDARRHGSQSVAARGAGAGVGVSVIADFGSFRGAAAPKLPKSLSLETGFLRFRWN